MNLQIERIEGHLARLSVEIEPKRWERAKSQAARKISREVDIRGFRKGKAPYKRVAQIVGEGTILEEAAETLGKRIYPDALDESGLQASGYGELADLELEPTPIIVYTVPLRPEVDLGDYLNVRLDYSPPTIDESDVDEQLRGLQMQHAEVLDDDVLLTEWGHRVTINAEGVFVDGEEGTQAIVDDEDSSDEGDFGEAGLNSDADEAQLEGGANSEPGESESPVLPSRGDAFLSETDTPIILDPNHDPFIDGFVEQLVGVERGSDVIFELTIPDDDADETIRGRQVEFVVTINQIESLNIPDLDDEFARQVSRDNGDEEVDLAGLRTQTREALEQQTTTHAETEYAREVSLAILEGADIHYPDVLLEEEIDEAVREFENQVQMRGMNLETYLRFANTSRQDFRENFRERAEAQLRHSLVMRELVHELAVFASDEEVHGRFETMASNFGLDIATTDPPTAELSAHFRNQAIMDLVLTKLAALGRGEDMDAAVQAMRDRAEKDLQQSRARLARLKAQSEDDENHADDEDGSGSDEALLDSAAADQD